MMMGRDMGRCGGMGQAISWDFWQGRDWVTRMGLENGRNGRGMNCRKPSLVRNKSR